VVETVVTIVSYMEKLYGVLIGIVQSDLWDAMRMSLRREDVDYDMIRCAEKSLIQGWAPYTHPSGISVVTMLYF
jgi:hypothetical protein